VLEGQMERSMQTRLAQMEAVGLQLFEELCFWELIAHLLNVRIFISREGFIPGNRFVLETSNSLKELNFCPFSTSRLQPFCFGHLQYMKVVGGESEWLQLRFAHVLQSPESPNEGKSSVCLSF